MAHPVVHFEIGAQDHKQSAAFYGQLFGWEINSDVMPGYAMVQSGGEGGIGGGIMTIQDGMKPMVTVYVLVDDLDATLAKAEGLGATTVVPPTPIPGYGAFAWFADLDGNCVGIFKPAHGEHG